MKSSLAISRSPREFLSQVSSRKSIHGSIKAERGSVLRDGHRPRHGVALCSTHERGVNRASMRTAAAVVIAFVALEHLWFFVLESFLWQKPLGLKTFRMDAAKAAVTAPLAKNQGVYNAFLSAGLVWSLFASEPAARELGIFFLGCVAVAG